MDNYTSKSNDGEVVDNNNNNILQSLPDWNEKLPPPAIETITSLFGLSQFEKFILVFCAGVELDPEISQLCANAQDNPNYTYPTVGLALACLPHAHWSALTPASVLRRFRLIESLLFLTCIKFDCNSSSY